MTVGTWTVGRAAENPQGERLYTAHCKECHGPEGNGGDGPKLVPFKWTYEEALEQIRMPLCQMPAFPEADLSDAEVRAIVNYLKTIQ